MSEWEVISANAANIGEDVRDKWAVDLVQFVNDGDDAAYVACGDSAVFAMRVDDEVLVFDCKVVRERSEPYRQEAKPAVVRIRDRSRK